MHQFVGRLLVFTCGGEQWCNNYYSSLLSCGCYRVIWAHSRNYINVRGFISQPPLCTIITCIIVAERCVWCIIKRTCPSSSLCGWVRERLQISLHCVLRLLGERHELLICWNLYLAPENEVFQFGQLKITGMEIWTNFDKWRNYKHLIHFF